MPDPAESHVIQLLQYPAMTVRPQIDIVAKTLGVATYADSDFVAYNVDQSVHVFMIETGKEKVVIPNAPFGNIRLEAYPTSRQFGEHVSSVNKSCCRTPGSRRLRLHPACARWWCAGLCSSQLDHPSQPAPEGSQWLARPNCIGCTQSFDGWPQTARVSVLSSENS